MNLEPIAEDQETKEIVEWPPRDYDPLWHQLDFHRSKSKYKALISGIGGGKTSAGAIEAYTWAVLNPGYSGAIIVPDFRTWRNVVRPEIEKWWPQDSWIEKTKNELIHVFVHDKISKIYICSASNKEHVKKINGLNLTWFWIDEGARMNYGEQAWNFATGRLRENAERRSGWITMSPAGFNWFADAFGIETALPDSAYTNGVITRKYETEDEITDYYVRCAQTDWNTHLPRDYFKSLLRIYGGDERFVEQELYGKFLTQRDKILYNFSKPLHVIPHEVALQMFKGCPYRCGGVDWGERIAAMTWGGITRGGWSEGNHVTIGEYYRGETTAQELAVLAHKLNQEYCDDENYFKWFCDPESPGSIREWRTGFSWKEKKYPPVPNIVMPSSIPGLKWNQWKAGIDLLRMYMGYIPHRDHPAHGQHNHLGATRWYVSEKCVNLIREIIKYEKNKLVGNREVKRYDDATGDHHAIDTCRYRALGMRQVYESQHEQRRGF